MTVFGEDPCSRTGCGGPGLWVDDSTGELVCDAHTCIVDDDLDDRRDFADECAREAKRDTARAEGWW